MVTARGRALGKYQLIAEIARGGMGIVYLAMAQGPGGFHKLVVVKELKNEVVEEPAFLTMFLDEARLAARLSHPNIVQTNEVGHDGNRYFLAMEYLDGRGFDHVRRRARTMGAAWPLPMQLRVLSDMLAGLEYAHQLTDFDGTPLGIVHRDVSPQNVFVTFDGQVKLLDFGIAKAVDSVHETHAGVFKGKVSYMSPEQARGQKVDARADVFSAGVMLWEALTGRRTREGQNDQEKLWALVAADLPRASTVRPSTPPELDEICAHAMAWDRDRRFASARAFHEALEAYLTKANLVVTPRELASSMVEMFREDRASTNAIIEAHVAAARSGALNAVPVIDVAPQHSGASSMGTPSHAGLSMPGGPPPVVPPNTVPTDAAGLAGPPEATTSGGLTREQADTLIRKARQRVVFASAGAAALVAVIAWLAWPASERLPAAAPAAAPIEPAPVERAATVATGSAAPVAQPAPTPPPAHPHAVSVEIRVSPSEAIIAIDNVVVEGNPFAGNIVNDGAIHHVRASAPGYITKSLPIELDANVALDLSLERVAAPSRGASSRPVARNSSPPRAAPPPSRPPTARAEPDPPPAAAPEPERRPAPRPTSNGEVDPQGGSRPKRTIETENPYGGDNE